MLKIRGLNFTALLLLITVNCYAQQTEEPPETSGYGNNIVSFVPWAMNNRGFCLGLSYERFITSDGKFSLYIPVLYNQHASEQHEHDVYSEKNISIYGGFKYYTAGSHAPVRYALGFLVGDAISIRHVTRSVYNGGTVERNETVTSTLVGCMFHNSLNVFFKKHFSYSLELNLGIATQNTPAPLDAQDDSLPFVLLQMSFGYRF